MSFLKEIERRRTFGIISHPDAGKTTLTEKLLLFGGAIQEAGAVKNNKIKKGATSDFMEIERQRGISVSTSVLAFNYKGKKINILDTPGRHRVLIGDEVGLGKTVVAGLIIQELLAANPGLRVLYLAPARLVSNVGREFKRLALFFREWKATDGDARLETDSRIIASIHRAVHPNHFDRLLKLRPWDLIIVDECHHLSDWGEGGGDPVMKYRLVRDLVAAQSAESRLLLLSGTPHQAHAARFENLLRLLQTPGESQAATAGRVIYRTKEDVRDWDGNLLFPKRQVNPPFLATLLTRLDERPPKVT